MCSFHIELDKDSCRGWGNFLKIIYNILYYFYISNYMLYVLYRENKCRYVILADISHVNMQSVSGILSNIYQLFDLLFLWANIYVYLMKWFFSLTFIRLQFLVGRLVFIKRRVWNCSEQGIHYINVESMLYFQLKFVTILPFSNHAQSQCPMELKLLAWMAAQNYHK